MRLGKVYELLEYNLQLLNFDSAEGPNGTQINNVRELIEAAETLSNIPALERAAADFLGSIPRPGKKNNIVVYNSIALAVNTKLQALRSVALQLRGTLKATIAPVDEGTLYFRIPTDLDLVELAKTIESLDQSLKQILGVVAPETRIDFKGFDTGSAWLVLMVLGKVGLTMKIIDYAIKLASKGLDLRKQYLETESLAIDLRLKQNEAELVEAKMKAQTKQFAQNLLNASQVQPSNGNEDLERISRALTELQILFQRGSKVEVPLITSQLAPSEADEIKKDVEQLETLPPELLNSPS